MMSTSVTYMFLRTKARTGCAQMAYHLARLQCLSSTHSTIAWYVVLHTHYPSISLPILPRAPTHLTHELSLVIRINQWLDTLPNRRPRKDLALIRGPRAT